MKLKKAVNLISCFFVERYILRAKQSKLVHFNNVGCYAF